MFHKTGLKGKYHAKKAKNVCLSTETKKKLSSLVINYHSSAIKLSISASGQRHSRQVWIET